VQVEIVRGSDDGTGGLVVQGLEPTPRDPAVEDAGRRLATNGGLGDNHLADAELAVIVQG
jgi:hypothetical protein